MPQTAADLIELWRGDLKESVHCGHAVICDSHGIVEAWGRASKVVYPRSSCKMIQALPLVESGAAEAFGLTPRHLALACASHQGTPMHTGIVAEWLQRIGCAEPDLRCGAHLPTDPAERQRMICADEAPCQLHNNCSGKHTGFLTLNRHINGGAEYIEIDHPVQKMVRAAFEDLTDDEAAGWGIDGCSAPNFACTVEGLARAMQRFATPGPDMRGAAQRRLTEAMLTYPELVAGEGRADTELMRAMGGKVVLKMGAEAMYVAILPEQGVGVALKVSDGGRRGAEAAITALMIHLGALDPAHPVVAKYLTGPIRNWRGLLTGELRRAPGFP